MDKVCSFKIKGMQRDLSASSFSADYAYENMNVRIMPTNEQTLFSIVNEKGTKLCQYPLLGIPIGQATIDKYLIMFSHEDNVDKPDKITKISIDPSNQLDVDIDILYEGNLNLDPKYPIETLSFYENSDIMKVYWTDGKNQPRFINIASSEEIRNNWNDSSFDFIPKLQLKERVTITKSTTGGSFEAGVIQYVLTYYNKYGQQSNIFYISPLYYISQDNLGIAPNKNASNMFNITVSNVDTTFDYIRVYSIQSTSVDTNRIVKLVANIAISKNNPENKAYIVDTGNIGETLSDTNLLYVGGKHIIADTIKDKDNTLFLGNLKIQDTDVRELREIVKDNVTIKEENDAQITFQDENLNTSYEYTGQLNKGSNQITYFKYGETYRFGLQLQNEYGIWSDPIFIKDYTISNAPISSSILKKDNTNIKLPVIYLNSIILNRISNFKKVRPVVVYPSSQDRTVVCQGVLCPTVYSVKDRDTNTPYAQSSWFTRPNAPFPCLPDPMYDSTGALIEDEFAYGSYCPLKVINSSNAIYRHQFTNYSRAGVMQNSSYIIDGKKSDTINKGAWVEFRHNYPIPSSNKRNAEIQCQYYQKPITPKYTYNTETSQLEYVTKYDNYFFVDQSIVTFHSPEIEFDSSVQNMDMRNLKLKIVGIVPITATQSDIDIAASSSTQTTSYTSLGEKITKSGKGLYKEPIKTYNQFISSGDDIEADSLFGWRGLVSGTFWNDCVTEKSGNSVSSIGNDFNFVVYPWHRNGSLNNAKYTVDNTRPSMLEKKQLINYRYSYKTQYFSKPFIGLENNVSDIQVFNSTEVSNLKLKGPGTIGTINYYGNVDKLITTPPYVNTLKIDAKGEYNPVTLDGYPIFAIEGATLHDKFTNNSTNYQLDFNTGRGSYTSLYYVQYPNKDKMDYTGIDPIRMKYKSSPHAVIALGISDKYETILPTFLGMNNSTNVTLGNKYTNSLGTTYVNNIITSFQADEYYFYDKSKSIRGTQQGYITLRNYGINNWMGEYISSTIEGVDCGFLWLADLYNTSINEDTRFGGKSDEALENNVWIPCGEAVDVSDVIIDKDSNKSSLKLVCTQGDTYYQRYDHLKTYPFSTEDQNQVIDIISFMCETRVNLDGRYDKNRGTTNLYYTPENFNKLNTAYSQTNNYFKYQTTNPNKIDLNNFHNSITWTKTKTLGELIDSWTNVTLASTLDLDGDKGPVRSLKRFNNNLFAFQDKGISQILYNDNVQIASTQGVPIEIANSGKVSGKRYLTEVGCTNKWSICQTPSGLYFIDDITKGIYLFNGQLNNLSDKLGFHSWINSESKSIEPWNPIDFQNFVSYYDKVNGDVFFISKDKCLGFSEPLGQFASFYSYEDTPYFANIQDKGIWIKQDGTLWMHLEGEYNNFFGENKPFYTTIIANPDPQIDKTFNTVEFRADSFKDNKFITTRPFDTLKVWNEYQSGISNFDGDRFAPKNPLRQKFRVWRANIPRSDENYRDRIRNPWTYIQLINKGETTNKVLLHDIVVHYFQ